MPEGGQYICCCVCCVIITLIIYFISAISSLPVNTWGLDYNGIYKEIGDDVWESGIHRIGFMHSFVEYPSQVQNTEFSDQSGADRGPIESRS